MKEAAATFPARHDLQSTLLESDGFLLASLGAESRQRFMQAVSRWDVGWQHQSVLTALLLLAKHGEPSQQQLGDFVGIDRRNLVPVIDGLEERGLVERTADPTDRRRYRVRLTASGKAMAQQIEAARQELEETMFACLTADEKGHLHRLLLTLHRSIEEDTNGFER